MKNYQLPLARSRLGCRKHEYVVMGISSALTFSVHDDCWAGAGVGHPFLATKPTAVLFFMYLRLNSVLMQ